MRAFAAIAAVIVLIVAGLLIVPLDRGAAAPNVDECAPSVAGTGITVSSDPGPSQTYRSKDIITVTVPFTVPVSVTGTPSIDIKMDPAYGQKTATYAERRRHDDADLHLHGGGPQPFHEGHRGGAEHAAAQWREYPVNRNAGECQPGAHRTVPRHRPQGRFVAPADAHANTGAADRDAYTAAAARDSCAAAGHTGLHAGTDPVEVRQGYNRLLDDRVRAEMVRFGRAGDDNVEEDTLSRHRP